MHRGADLGSKTFLGGGGDYNEFPKNCVRYYEIRYRTLGSAKKVLNIPGNLSRPIFTDAQKWPASTCVKGLALAAPLF